MSDDQFALLLEFDNDTHDFRRGFELGCVWKALADLESWQPQTDIGMLGLHPQHLEALENARAVLAAVSVEQSE